MSSSRNFSQSAKRSQTLAEPGAFSDFFDRTHIHVYRYIFALTGGPQLDVEDFTAETYTRAWHARERFQGDQQAGLRWVLRIARNLVIDHRRREGRRSPEVSIDPIEIPARTANPEEQYILQESADLLLVALQHLSDTQREMIVLRYILGWRVKDIAIHLNIAENTVSVTLRRILERIRKNWPVS